MGNKIKKSDLFDDNLFPSKEAEAYATQVSAVVIAQDKLIEQKMKVAQGVNFDSSKSIVEFNKAVKEANASMIISEKAKQAQIRTEQLMAQQIARTTKAQEKANSEYAQANEQLKRLEKRQLDNVIAGRELSKTGVLVAQSHEELRSKVEGAERGVGRFQRNVGNYSNELRKLQKELQGLEPGTKQFNDLAQKAGVLKDKINDAKDATKAFASESKTQTAKTLFGQIVSDFKDLDFKGAADKSKQLASVVSSISFKEVSSGIKDFGSSLLNLGKAVFLNPLTGIVAAIGLVVYALKDTYDAWQNATGFAEKYADALKDVRERTEDLKKSTRDLKIENLNIAESQKEQLKARNKFTDEYVSIEKKKNEALAKINADYIEQSKASNGELLLSGVGGNISAQKRAERLLIEREQAKKKIIEDANNGLAALQENYQEILKKNYKNDEKNQKKSEENKLKVVKETKEKEIKIREAKAELDDEDFKKKQKQLEDEARLLKESDERDILQGKIRADRREKELEDEKRKRAEIARIESELTDAINAAIQQRQEKNNAAIDQEIANRERSINEQQSLAERGLDNTLAFEKEQAAKLQLAKKQEAERQRKQDEAIKLAELFLNSLNSKLADGKTTYLKASSEALAETFAAKGLTSLIAGSFFEGTEKVEDDLKGNKIHNGRDGYMIAVDGKERILNPFQNGLLGDMSNDEVVRRALMNPSLPGLGGRMTDSMMLNQMLNIDKGVRQLNDTLKNKPVQQVSVDSFGNIIETVYKNNEKVVTTFMNKNRRRPI